VNGSGDSPETIIELDINYRMLQNTELAAAMSFTTKDDEYLFTDASTADVTRMLGNAVAVETASALIRNGLRWKLEEAYALTEVA
jgi:site-specific DNA-cytosine methylase